jgi:hypothetical protein
VTREPYVPPTGDEPLDAIELAIVRALIPVFAETIRQQLVDEQRAARDAATDTTTVAEKERRRA